MHLSRYAVQQMTPNQFIDQALGTPFAFGEGSWTGCDCWGLVELWYRELRGIELSDRGDYGFGHEALQEWFDAGHGRWIEVDEPQDHDLVIMSVGQISAAHVGIFWDGSVLHTSNRIGCTFQPLTNKMIASSATGFLTHQ